MSPECPECGEKVSDLNVVGKQCRAILRTEEKVVYLRNRGYGPRSSRTETVNVYCQGTMQLTEEEELLMKEKMKEIAQKQQREAGQRKTQARKREQEAAAHQR